MKKKLRTAFEKMRNYLERLHTGFTSLISKKHLADIRETLFLYANKDTQEKIISALKQPIEEGEEINWKSTS